MDKRLMIKFGKREHLEAFQKEGIIYCNPIKYFLELEDEKVRGDIHESTIELRFMENAELELRPIDGKSPFKKLNVQNVSLRKHYPKPLGNLFCMSAIKVEVTDEPKLHHLDKRFAQFGTHFLMIYDQITFFKRLKNALDNCQLKYDYKLVDYVDLKKYTGSKTVFQKDVSYSYQEEFRIFIEHDKAEPLMLQMESIEDISILYELAQVPSFLVRSQPFNNPSSANE